MTEADRPLPLVLQDHLSALLTRARQEPELTAEMERARRDFFDGEEGPRSARNEQDLDLAAQRFSEWFLLERESDVLGGVRREVLAMSDFDRERIQHGMLRACEKLPVAIADIEEAVQRIETRCQGEYDREVPSSVIGSLVMEELKRLHQVAYVRFASVYREFKDVGQFMSELETMLDEDVAQADEQ